MSTTTPEFTLGIHIASLLNLAGLVIWVYDYCITLKTEVYWIWGKRWDMARVIFTMARYIPLLHCTVTVYSAVANRSGNCHPLDVLGEVAQALSITAAEGLLVLRTYKFWNGNGKLVFWVIGFGIFLSVTSIIFSSVLNGNAPLGYTNLGGCLLITSRTNASGYGALLLHELVLSCLIVRSSMPTAVYRRTMMYISCIILMTLLNFVMTVAAPAPYMETFVALQVATQSALSSRVLFDSFENPASWFLYALP